MANSFHRIFFALLFTPFLQSVSVAQTEAPAPPVAAKRPVTDEYHGVKVVDDYRWLEDWDNPDVKEWSQAQNKRAREYLDQLPSRPAIKERLEKLMTASSSRYFELSYRGGALFAMKAQPPKQQPMLVILQSADDPGSERILVDPNPLSDKGSIAIDFYVPSWTESW